MTKWQSLLTEEDFTSNVLSAMVVVVPSPGEVMVLVTWQLLVLTDVHSFSPLSSLRPVRPVARTLPGHTRERRAPPGASVHCCGPSQLSALRSDFMIPDQFPELPSL